MEKVKSNNKKPKTSGQKPEKKKTISKPEAGNRKQETSSNFLIPLKDLLEAGCHFGHQARRWNPKMKPFIYCAKDGVHIFDLAKTSAYLQKACLAAKKMVSEGGDIVFVGTKRQAQAIVKEEATAAGAFYVATRWLGGTISNWPQIEKSIKKLQQMKEQKQKGEFDKYTKKENILIDKEIARLERFFGGLSGLKKSPSALFVIDTVRESTAIKEAIQVKAEIFGITDSNADPDLVDFPIPANDDAVRSIKLVVGTFAKAVAEGMTLRSKEISKV